MIYNGIYILTVTLIKYVFWCFIFFYPPWGGGGGGGGFPYIGYIGMSSVRGTCFFLKTF